MGHMAQSQIPFIYNFSPVSSSDFCYHKQNAQDSSFIQQSVVSKPLDWGDLNIISG